MLNIFGQFEFDEKNSTLYTKNGDFYPIKANKLCGAYNITYRDDTKERSAYALGSIESVQSKNIIAIASGKMFGFELVTKDTKRPYIRFSIAYQDKAYLSCAAYSYSYDSLKKLIDKQGLSCVDRISVTGLYSSKQVNDKYYQNLLVNSFQIESWVPKDKRTGGLAATTEGRPDAPTEIKSEEGPSWNDVVPF